MKRRGRKASATIGAKPTIYLSSEEQALANQLKARYESISALFVDGLRALEQLDQLKLARRDLSILRQFVLDYTFGQTSRETLAALLPKFFDHDLAQAMLLLFESIRARIQQPQTHTQGEAATAGPASQARPLALIIEDDAGQILLIERLLKGVGFEVRRASSLLEGRALALELLDLQQVRPAPTLLILDLMFPAAGSSPYMLEGTLLAAYLNEAMEAGEIQSAWIVALTGAATEERRREALVAGCFKVFEKPFLYQHAQELYDLMATPPRPGPFETTPSDHVLMQVLRRTAHQYFSFFLQPQPASETPEADTLWDEEHVNKLLFHPASLKNEEPWYTWLSRRGGYAGTYQQLANLQLDDQDLQKLLNLYLQHTYMTKGAYADALGISETTRWRWHRRLLSTLVGILNDMSVD